MNVRDLSKDDDFLSHLLVEKLGTGGVPLYVHKMDPSRKLPKVDAEDLMVIVRRVRGLLFSCYSVHVLSFACPILASWYPTIKLVTSKLGPHIAVRQAVDELLAFVVLVFAPRAKC